MTRGEFKKLEAECKNMWYHLAITGSSEKPESSKQFYLDCPACHISRLNFHNCVSCPIDKWREIAQTNYIYGFRNAAICEYWPNSSYAKWWSIHSTAQQRRELALEIAEMHWSWSPEYAHTKIVREEER